MPNLADSIHRCLAAAFAPTEVSDIVADATVTTHRDGYTVTLPEDRRDIVARVAALIRSSLEQEAKDHAANGHVFQASALVAGSRTVSVAFAAQTGR